MFLNEVHVYIFTVSERGLISGDKTYASSSPRRRKKSWSLTQTVFEVTRKAVVANKIGFVLRMAESSPKTTKEKETDASMNISELLDHAAIEKILLYWGKHK